jgi:hypothetical protein
MVRTFLKVYMELGSYFLFLQEQIKDIIIMHTAGLLTALKHLFYSVRPSKQPLMVRTFLKVYMELGSYFLFLQEQIKDIIIMHTAGLLTGMVGERAGVQ